MYQSPEKSFLPLTYSRPRLYRQGTSRTDLCFLSPFEIMTFSKEQLTERQKFDMKKLLCEIQNSLFQEQRHKCPGT